MQNSVNAPNSYNKGMNNTNYINNNYGGGSRTNRITLNNFRPEDLLLIDGIVEFSHITRFYEGEELDVYNRRSKSRYPQTKPFISLTVSDPKVSCLCKTPLVPEYIDSVSYISKTSGKKMMNFKTLSANNYSRRRFPRLSVNLADYSQGQANLADLEMQEGYEPAKGSRVTVILKVYGSNGNNSGSIQEVILHDNPPRFYCNASNNRTESQLEALGITRSASPYTEQPTIVTALDNNMEEDFRSNGYSSGQMNQPIQNNGYKNGFQNQQPNPYMQYGQQNQQAGYGQSQVNQQMNNNGGYGNGYQTQNNQQYQPGCSNYQQGSQNGFNGNQPGAYNPNNDPNRRY
ncbi:hypothetical protein AAK899_02540 [Erysipelotrichaceae bacterium 51-3]